jgi:hypothetical protein
MKKVFVLFLTVFVVAVVSAAETAHWGISKKVKVVVRDAIGLNKRIALKKANTELDLILNELEKECMDEGWKYTELSRKELDVRQRRHSATKRARVQSIVVCEDLQ